MYIPHTLYMQYKTVDATHAVHQASRRHMIRVCCLAASRRLPYTNAGGQALLQHTTPHQAIASFTLGQHDVVRVCGCSRGVQLPLLHCSAPGLCATRTRSRPGCLCCHTGCCPRLHQHTPHMCRAAHENKGGTSQRVTPRPAQVTQQAHPHCAR